MTAEAHTHRRVWSWRAVGVRYLPFANSATPELPLGRLLRLSLFQVTVGMAAVLLIGTLNRVMIVELGIPAWVVATMISLPLVFAPLRMLVGHRSDTHRSVLGWRRVPYIWFGSLMQFGGLAIMPFALLLLSGDSHGPPIVGQAGAALAFLLAGAGLHTTQTAGLALATDLAPAHVRPKVVALLCLMLLVGSVVAAVGFGLLLTPFSELRLIQVVQGAAALTMVVNGVALWKQEPRRRMSEQPQTPAPGFREAWAAYLSIGQSRRRLVAIGLGTVAFSMQDVLLEPYGGKVLHLPVGVTTLLTAVLAIGGGAGLGLAARVLGRGADPYRVAGFGAVAGLVAFSSVIFAAPTGLPGLFADRRRHDRLRGRHVRPRHPHGLDEHGPGRRHRPRPRRLGLGPGSGGGDRHRRRRPDQRQLRRPRAVRRARNRPSTARPPATPWSTSSSSSSSSSPSSPWVRSRGSGSPTSPP